jgi:hypothetical protein
MVPYCLTAELKGLNPRPEQRGMSRLVLPQHGKETKGAGKFVSKTGPTIVAVGRSVIPRRFQPRIGRRLRQILPARAISQTNRTLKCRVRFAEVVPASCEKENLAKPLRSLRRRCDGLSDVRHLIDVASDGLPIGST